MNSRTQWMHEKKFGLMVHWFPSSSPETWGVPPQRGERCLDPDKVVAQFDLDRFMADYRASGAEWMHSPLTIKTPSPGEMEVPLYSLADLHRLVSDFKAAGGGVTFNVGIFQEGGLGTRTVARLA